ncbi:helix-turn-helix domain-containing protein [Streptomyces sp. NPDC052396]|uniref:helix-turn-helix domain-containing protein n=1 Tax=Streptomyces sp. NPDC052396 TaxID=3365689 RepID=UPI0037D630BE
MVEGLQDFGQELRRRRQAAGMSLARLGTLVHYSKAQLSKVERGLKRPTPELARLCDVRLAADGALAGLVPVRPCPAPPPDAGAQGWYHPLGRRQLVFAGAASALGVGIAAPAAASELGEPAVLEIARSLFDQFRKLGQVVGPALVLPALTAQTHSLRDLALQAGHRGGPGLLSLTSRFAEYAGWMAQEAGDEPGALRWTGRAVELAAAAGDRDFAAYGLVRQALVTFYRDDSARTIALSHRARAGTRHPRIAGLAAQQEAQGHALAGDYDACMRSLEEARELLARPDDRPDEPVIGTSHLPDPVQAATGWCLHDLGCPRQAAALLDQVTARIPEHALRMRARFGVRRALAHAAAGEVEQACVVTRELLQPLALVRSATIGTDLRRLAHALSRHDAVPAVRELSPELNVCLRLAGR